MKNMSVTQRQIYAGMIREEFAPFIQRAESVANVMREGIRDEVRKEWQIDRLDKEIDRLKARVETLQRQREDLTGSKKYDHRANEHKLEEEVDIRLRQRDGMLFVLEGMQAKFIKELWLMDMPQEMRGILESIKQQLPEVEEKLCLTETKLLEANHGK